MSVDPAQSHYLLIFEWWCKHHGGSQSARTRRIRSTGYAMMTADSLRRAVERGPTRDGGRLSGILGGSGAAFGGRLLGPGIGCPRGRDGARERCWLPDAAGGARPGLAAGAFSDIATTAERLRKKKKKKKQTPRLPAVGRQCSRRHPGYFPSGARSICLPRISSNSSCCPCAIISRY